jgi:hypothetical protein
VQPTADTVVVVEPAQLGALGWGADRSEVEFMTRDSRVWWFGMIGGIVGAIALHADQFPTLLAYPVAKELLALASIVIAVVSGKMATSPLPGEHD